MPLPSVSSNTPTLLLPLTPFPLPLSVPTFAAYSMAAFTDSSAAATTATTAVHSVICVDVRAICRTKSPFAARAVAPAAVRVCKVERRPLPSQSSISPLPSQSSVAPVPFPQSLTPVLNPAQPRLPRTDRESELPSHLAPVRNNARVLVPITNGAIETSSYGGYCVANSICDSSNSEPSRNSE